MYRYIKLIVIATLLLILVQNTASANHPYSPKRHLTTMGSSSSSEFFCVDTTGSTLTFTTSYNTLENILYFSSYDGLASGKIDFVGSTNATQCSGFSAGDLSLYNIRYYLQTSTTPLCDGTSSCVTRYGATTVNGHSHYSYEIATIKSSSFTNVPGYMVNHETGHIMGLFATSNV